MSRRREAAELARALELSTQTPPSLTYDRSYRSSGISTTFTQDSRELELQPCTVPQQQQHPQQQMVMSMAHIAPMPSLTVRPGDVMGPPAPGTGTESFITSSGSGPQSSGHSDIGSFPPTSNGDAAPAIVPATDSASRSGSNTSKPPYNSSGIIPSSFANRRPPSSNPDLSLQSPAWSSPNVPLPDNAQSSSRGSTFDKSHVSSTELSSNRPLFSPTQTSKIRSNNGSGTSIAGSSRPGNGPPAPLRTYGRASTRTPSPRKASSADNATRQRIILSSSPPSEEGQVNRSPLKKHSQKIIHVVSDEEEEEEEEPIEMPTVVQRSKIEVILPRKTPTSSTSEKRNSLEQATRNGKTPHRHGSPDPLDSLDGRRIDSPVRPMRNNRQTPIPVGPTSSATTSTVPASGTTSSGTPAHDQTMERRSTRVADNKAKEQADKEEARRLRRERKDREKLAAEKKAGKVGQSSGRIQAQETTSDSRASPLKRRREASPTPHRGPTPPIEESIVPISPPRSSSNMVQDKATSHTETAAAAASTRGTKRKNDVGDTEDDDEFDPDHMEDKPQNKSRAKGKGKVAAAAAKKGKKLPVKGKGKKQVEQAAEAEVDEVVAEMQSKIEEKEKDVVPVEEKQAQAEPSRTKSPSPPPQLLSPTKSVSPTKRPPLRAALSNTPGSIGSPLPLTNRPSPGPTINGTPSKPGGINWKAPRDDLSTVLAKFGGAKRSGMSKKLKITPLHQKIGPGVKSLPPPPPKPTKKKVDDDDEDDEEGDEEEGEGEGKKGKSKGKGMEWYMVED